MVSSKFVSVFYFRTGVPETGDKLKMQIKRLGTGDINLINEFARTHRVNGGAKRRQEQARRHHGRQRRHRDADFRHRHKQRRCVPEEVAWRRSAPEHATEQGWFSATSQSTASIKRAERPSSNWYTTSTDAADPQSQRCSATRQPAAADCAVSPSAAAAR